MRIAKFALIAVLASFSTANANAEDVFVRFKLVEPADVSWYVQLGGFIHKPNWYLPRGVVPVGADRDKAKRVKTGAFSPWFDLSKHAGKLLHGRMNRAGGVAEFPNVTARFVVDKPSPRRKVVIELADNPTEDAVVKRFEESFAGDLTSFLVSPKLRADADSLETAGQMSARRLAWAEAATDGKRVSPKRHIIQTSFWGPQRAELNLQEAQVLNLLGFNVVGGQRPEVRKAFPHLRVPGHTHRVAFGPAATKGAVESLMRSHAAKQKTPLEPGVPYGFADEICCRPRIGSNTQARKHFHEWLEAKGVAPKSLGVEALTDVIPLETPEAYRSAAKVNAAAAARVFYYTSRFRQEWGTKSIRWHTEAYHKHYPKGGLTTTLVADHPYFGGTGLGMGMAPNTAWGGAPLALDWFDMARHQAVDLFGIEDWMGLQYMYGPNYTWEGFQLMGFQASMFRSGGQRADADRTVPIIAWITPSDETNLRLKSHSALCQGAKHFFYWTFGPTATSTENYWSDLRGAYDGVARVTRQLAAAEDVLYPAKLRPTRVALLYSISSDLWQPYGYRSMLERRGVYLSLVHGQYKVDMLTEEDIDAGRLDRYSVLYATGPNIKTTAAKTIRDWVKAGGHLFATGNAGSRNEFNEPDSTLAEALGIESVGNVTLQNGNYRVRGHLNAIPHLDRVAFTKALAPQREPAATDGEAASPTGFGVIGVKAAVKPDGAGTIATFKDGSPAVLTHRYGKGHSVFVATTPGISYIKDARFVPKALKEKWPAAHRRFINALARQAGVAPPVKLSHPVVEAGVYEGPKGVALVLANFTYEKIDRLKIDLPTREKVTRVYTADTPGKAIPFETRQATGQQRDDGYPIIVSFTLPLGLDQIVLLR